MRISLRTADRGVSLFGELVTYAGRNAESFHPDRGCLKYDGTVLLFVSEVKTFFRHCPSCGRRFHIKLVRKEEVAGDVVKEHLTSAEEEMGSGMMHANPTLTPLAEGRTVYVDIEEFDYTYKCTHCGHQWSEVHEEEEPVGT
jgi:DNA-directed RNA polymerase subunit RPC12/RpoP